MDVKKIILGTLFCAEVLMSGEGIDQLNFLRERSGLPPMLENEKLNQSSQNHSNYMDTNDIFSHYEDRENNDYTGDTVDNRVDYADYASVFVAENILHSLKNPSTAVDALFAGIYHRFNFLDFSWSEVGEGMGEESTYFTFNMGNSDIRSLCEDSPYTDGDYYTPCADSTIKVPADDYDNAINSLKEQSIDIVLYPPKDGDFNLPAFYEELPDPLEDYKVSGFPVSATFNSAFFETAPTVSDFFVLNKNGDRVEDILVMNKDNDPNHLFNEWQHAVFPEKRLAWGTRYDAEIHYSYNGEDVEKRWCFSTKSLSTVAQRYYEFSEDANVTAVDGTSYALYIMPRDENDTISNLSYTYNTDTPSIGWIDNNTLLVTITGDEERYLELSIEDGFTIRLTIAKEDSATVPAFDTCGDYDGDGIPNEEDSDDDGDGYLDYDEIVSGSNPFDIKSVPSDFDHDFISDLSDFDDDNDGISDVLEIENGLNPFNYSDGVADEDGDGFSNAIEINTGTDMRDSESFPIWTPIVSGDGLMFFVPSI